ncbi:hypothetical protein ACFBZI_08375 [Moraxella sp. ZJ142]|uniref:hypothetical protein n=1 Tax=Moraxella marmotae TaxID=3344520 RepID=UPI0035D46704
MKDSTILYIAVVLFALAIIIGEARASTATYYADKFHGRKTASGEMNLNPYVYDFTNELVLATVQQIDNVLMERQIQENGLDG